MSKLLLFILLIVAFKSFSQGNACSSADAITVGNCLSGERIGNGTDDGGNTSCDNGTFQNDGWYSFVGDGYATTITFAATSNDDDPAIYVFTGTCAAKTFIQCNNTTVGVGVDTETIVFTTTAGVTYWIQIKNQGSGNGRMTGDICVSSTIPPPPPANDNCSTAVVLTPGATCTPTSGTVAGATASGTATGACSGTPDDDVWYRFQATQTTHTVTISPTANLNSYMQLYSGTCAALTSMTCSDPNTFVATGLTVGTTYYIRVYSFGSSPMSAVDGTFGICVTTSTITCAGLGPIISGGNLTSNYSHNSQSTCGAGDDVISSEITSCGTSYYYDGEEVVYNFIPSTSGSINITLTSSGTWTGLSVFSGCPTSGGACLGVSQSSTGNKTLTCIGVIAGQNYYVIIDSWPSPDCNPYSLSVSAPVAQTAPACASGLFPANGTTGVCNTAAALSWTAPPGTCSTQASAYDIYFGTSPTPPLVTSTSATSYDPGGLATGTTYYYRIVPKNGGGPALNCPIQSFTTLAGSTTCNLGYTTSSPTYGPLVTGTAGSWTNLTFSDDRFANANTSLPFNFCFDGIQYSQFLISSNGYIIFPPVGCSNNLPGGTNAAPGGYSAYSFSTNIPNTTSAPRNAIMLWQDIDPSISGSTIRYKTIGTSPNRIFVLDFATVGMFSCSTQDFTAQFWLYETTNVIEIHVLEKTICSTWNEGNAILGLHNFDGTRAVLPSNAYNATSTNWSISSGTAFRFTPNATCSTACSPLSNEFIELQLKNTNNLVKLNWKYIQKKSDTYIIERSRDGRKFEQIGKIFNDKDVNFEYDDITPNFGLNYYRVYIVDENNNKLYSNVESVNFVYKNQFLLENIYPSPANEVLNLDLYLPENADLEVKVLDITGKELIKHIISINSGTTKYTLNISSLSHGSYQIIITNPNSRFNTITKFVK